MTFQNLPVKGMKDIKDLDFIPKYCKCSDANVTTQRTDQ